MNNGFENTQLATVARTPKFTPTEIIGLGENTFRIVNVINRGHMSPLYVCVKTTYVNQIERRSICTMKEEVLNRTERYSEYDSVRDK